MSTLYRDYRPQNFKEILGQNHIKITLQNEISADKVAQAFLFCGPRAVGKTTLARVLAKAINCQNHKPGEYEPCNQCPSCLSITAGNNLDVVEIDAASNTGVDNVRENIISFSRLSPVNSKFKVFIIDEVHMLSLSAFNALLKIIEEPPKHIIFILCTTEIHKVPLTIISRCERFDFQRISVADIVKKLTTIAQKEKVEIDKQVLEAVARKSSGHLRDAESLLGQIFSLGDKKITLEQAELVIPHYNSSEAVDLLEYLSRKDAVKAIGLVNKLIDSGVNIKNFSGEIIALLRQVMLNKLNPSLANNLGLNLGETLDIKLNQVTDNFNWEDLFSATRQLLAAHYDNKNLLIPQLPLELAIAEICLSVQKMYTPSNSSSRLNFPADSTVKKMVSTPLKDDNNSPIIVKKAILNLSQEEIKEKWPEFLVKIKKYNHSLSFVLQNCEPREIKEGKLCLVFKYKFHQDRLNDNTIKGIVERTLTEVFGSGLTFSSLVDENLEVVKKIDNTDIILDSPNSSVPLAEIDKKSSGLISDLLKNFGGEIIN